MNLSERSYCNHHIQIRDRDSKYAGKGFAGFGMDFEAFQPASRFWTVLRDAKVVAHEPGCFGKLRCASRRHAGPFGGVSKSGTRPVVKCLEMSPNVSKIRDPEAPDFETFRDI